MTEPDTLTTAPAAGVVRGTMQEPWSDYTGPRFAAGGPLLTDLVGRLGLGGSDRALVLGPHTPELIGAIAAAVGSRPTVLVRGTGDARALVETGAPASVIAGSLDGLAESDPGEFSVVVALDGLDRVLSYDSHALSFEEVLRLVIGLAGPGARLAIGHEYAAAPVNVLDARPACDRYGDAAFRPFHSDPTRPATADALLDLVERVADRPADDLLTLFGPARAPRLAVRSSPDAVPDPPALTSYAVHAAHAHRRPLLAQPDEFIHTLAGAGRLRDAADGGVVLCGTRAAFDLARVSPSGTLTVAGSDRRTGDFATLAVKDVTAAGWPDDAATEVTESETAQPSETARYVHPQTPPTRVLDARIHLDPSLVPPRLRLTPTVEDEFVRLAALGEVPAFRELARSVGAHVESVPVTDRRVLTFDNLHLHGRDFVAGTDASCWSQTVGTASALATAFWLLSDRLRSEHLRQPWPDHVQGESLVGMWVEMAGHDVPGSVVSDARRLADAVIRSRPRPSGSIPDLRTALADAQRARKELADVQGQVFGLERTIGFRDKQLRTREQVIRNLRASGATGGAATQARASTAVRIVKRTSQVRSVGELTAGMDRVLKRAKRNRAAVKAR